MSETTFKNMSDIFDCIYTRPYAEDDYSINDFVDNLVRSLSWYMFEHQDELCYNITEKNPPMLKDCAIERMQNFLNTEFGWVRNYIICRMLISYRMNNVDLGKEAEWYLREEFDDDSWKKLNEAINKHVWDDYCKYLGSEKTKTYFENINRPEFIPKEIKES